MNPRFFRGFPTLAIVLHDVGMTWLCWAGLVHLRLALGGVDADTRLWSVQVLLVLAAQGIVFWRTGLYRGLWRFASLPDLLNIIKAALAGLLVIIVALFLYNRLHEVPRSVLVSYPLALSVMLGLPRLLYRLWKDHGLSLLSLKSGTRQRVLILGAGKTGEMLARELGRNPAWQVIGFVDDAGHLQGRRIQGVPVLGRARDVARIAPEAAAELLVIAMPSLAPDGMRRLVEACERTGLGVRMVPRLDTQGYAPPSITLKEIEIEDLLGRAPVVPDRSRIRRWLDGSCILITGAGGSIGSELVRQCAHLGARALVLVDMNELALITITTELNSGFPDVTVIPVLGNCGDAALMRHALSQTRVDAVFHAAAYKHVPVLETQLREAISNNVLATETVTRQAIAANVGTFVLISTDKAIDPANVLGASKRLAEMACQALATTSAMRLLTVRFGNVLNSAGSVVPLFREQIRKGGPVTVTDPEVTRYFMTIAEACQLILQAVAMDAPAQAVYTLDMGEPVHIRQLAEQMIRLTGQQPGRDIAIVYTGLRPGEKLHETLFHADEHHRPTSHPKILQAATRAVDAAAMLRTLDCLREAAQAYALDAISAHLNAAVPEFAPLTPNTPDAPGKVVAFPANSAASRRRSAPLQSNRP